MRLFKYAKKYIFKCKLGLLTFTLFSIIAQVMSIALPYLIGSYIDVLVRNQSGQEIIEFTKNFICQCLEYNIIFSCKLSICKDSNKSNGQLKF